MRGYMKDIVIIADFCGPLDGTYNSRFLYLADMLAKDNDVEIVTSDFDHSSKGYYHHEIEKHDYPIRLLHEGAYPQNVCLRRFYGHFIWGKNVKKYLNRRKKPDVIYCAIPTLTASYEAAKFCEKNGIRFVIDIQDLWPEAFRMAFHIPIISNILFAPFNALANGIYRRADAICAVSDTYCQRAFKKNRKCKETTTVFLGTELNTFDKYAGNDPVLEKKENEIWLGYAGTLSTSYDLPLIFEAMRKLSYSHLRLIVMGGGPKRKEFESQASGLNVTFLGRLEYSQMCGMLCNCDMVVNPIIRTSVASIINKHADYASCGKPVLNTQNSEEYRRLISDYKMGFNCDSVEELCRFLLLLINDVSLRITMGRNARKCAEELFNRAESYSRLVQEILKADE